MAHLRFAKPFKVRAFRPSDAIAAMQPMSVIDINLPTKDVPAAKAAWERHGEAGLKPWQRPKTADRHVEIIQGMGRWSGLLGPNVFKFPMLKSGAFVRYADGPAPTVTRRKLHPFTRMEDYQTWLSRRGFVRLGGGFYGSVWGKPGSSWVLKMGSNPEDGWPAYAALVMEKHADNPFAPRIKSLRWHGEFYVAVMERLGDVIDSRKPYRNIFGTVTGAVDPLWKLYRAAFHALGGFRPGHGVVELRLLQRRHPDLYRLVQDIRRDLVPHSHLDFHEGNVMIDLEGKRLVVTDPISSTSLDTRSLSTRRSRLTAA